MCTVAFHVRVSLNTSLQLCISVGISFRGRINNITLTTLKKIPKKKGKGKMNKIIAMRIFELVCTQIFSQIKRKKGTKGKKGRNKSGERERERETIKKNYTPPFWGVYIYLNKQSTIAKI